MKHPLLYLIFLFWFNSSSAQTTDSIPRQLDLRLVGSWSGFEKGSQLKGAAKYWVQHRADDGTFILLFTLINKKGEVQSTAEKGKWWVENGVFYELHFASGETDTYTYEILDNERTKFKLKSSAMSFSEEKYEFIDTKIKDL